MNYPNLKSPIVLGLALTITLSIVSYLYLDDLYKFGPKPKDE
jgi:hypothetical protein